MDLSFTSVRTNSNAHLPLTTNAKRVDKRLTVAIGSLFLMTCHNAYADNARESTIRTNEYRFEVIQNQVTRRSPDAFIAATFSGGGMRAASLAYGALIALRDTTINPTPPKESVQPAHPSPLIADVDFVSSVSGGSVTAAYWALHGATEEFDAFSEKFLKKKVQNELIGRMFDPPSVLKMLLTNFSRTDLLSDYYSETLVGKATYRDLLDETLRYGDRPYLVINATDMGTRSVFPFIQLQFDLLCDDLGKVKLADAVAASSAYPFAFSAITIPNLQAEDSSCKLPSQYREIESVVERNRNKVEELRMQWIRADSIATEREKDVEQSTTRYNTLIIDLEKARLTVDSLNNELLAARKGILTRDTNLAQSKTLLAVVEANHAYAVTHESNARKEYDQTELHYHTRIAKSETNLSNLNTDRREMEEKLDEILEETTEAGKTYASKLEWFVNKVGEIPAIIWQAFRGEDEPVDAFSDTVREFHEWTEKNKQEGLVFRTSRFERGVARTPIDARLSGETNIFQHWNESRAVFLDLKDQWQTIRNDVEQADNELRTVYDEFGGKLDDPSQLRRVLAFMGSLFPILTSLGESIAKMEVEFADIDGAMTRFEHTAVDDSPDGRTSPSAASPPEENNKAKHAQAEDSQNKTTRFEHTAEDDSPDGRTSPSAASPPEENNT